MTLAILLTGFLALAYRLIAGRLPRRVWWWITTGRFIR